MKNDVFSFRFGGDSRETTNPFYNIKKGDRVMQLVEQGFGPSVLVNAPVAPGTGGCWSLLELYQAIVGLF